jgi:hypothetical protein
MHRQKWDSNIKGANAEPGCGEWPNSRPSGDLVIRDKLLHRNASALSAVAPERAPMSIGCVPLVRVQLQHWPCAKTWLNIGVVLAGMVGVNRVGGIS